MNIMVVGLGSMGKRRIRLLRQRCGIKISGVDLSPQRRRECKESFGIDVYDSIENCCKSENIIAAVISTSPLSHHEIIYDCLSRGMHVFTEINLVDDGYEINMKKAADNHLALFLSSTMLYRKEVQYIHNKVEQYPSNVNYLYHVGQYLPEWHPWEKPQDFFVKDKRTNGCRELFAIELPWIVKTFGKIKEVDVKRDKMSSLKLDYPDNYLVTCIHENGNKGCLNVDVVSRKAVRNLEIYGENIYITWDGTAAGLKNYNIQKQTEEQVQLYGDIKKEKEYNSTIIENAYLDELEIFLELLEKKRISAPYGFEEDLETLKIIDRIEAGI